MSDYVGEDRRETQATQWHLKKEIPIATIFTMLGAIAAGSIWLGSLRKDIDMHYQEFSQHVIVEQNRIDSHQIADASLLAELRGIREDITAIKISLARSGVDRSVK